jgi:hypothetical protein
MARWVRVLGAWSAIAACVAAASVPGAGAVPTNGTVIIENGETEAPPGGSWVAGICPEDQDFVPLSTTCSGGASANVMFLAPGAEGSAVSLPAGQYRGVLASLIGTTVAFGTEGPITVVADEVVRCTVTFDAAPDCATDGPTGTVTVLVPVASAGAPYATGFCASGDPQLATMLCSDGTSATVLFPLAAGASPSLTLPPGTYNAALASFGGTSELGVIGTVTVAEGRTTICTFSMTAGPVCPTDGDDIDDADQTAVLSEDGSRLVLRSGAGSTLEEATLDPLPEDAPPLPGSVQAISGLVGFTIGGLQPGGEAQLRLEFEGLFAPTAYWKLLDGVWVDATSAASFAPGTTGTVVTLTIADGGPFDADGEVNGIVVDPGILARSAALVVTGFKPPVAGPRPLVVAAGSTVPLRWKVLDAGGAPVDDPASLVSLTRSNPCASSGQTPSGPTAIDTDALRSLDDGQWLLAWNTTGVPQDCHDLTATFADGSTITAAVSIR